MTLQIAGGPVMGRRQFNPILSIQHHASNRVTGQSVMLHGHKSLLMRLWEMMKQAGRP